MIKNNSTISKLRFTYVDIAKGICILLVARGHLNYNFLPDWANENEFYTIWYVSAFMVIAGFFCKEIDLYTPMTMIKKKGKVLYLKSLYFFLPATLLHNWFINHGMLSTSQPIYETGKDWGIAIGKVFCGLSFEKMVEPLWFAVTLFWGFLFLSIYLYMMRKLKWDNWKYETIGLLCSTSVICYINNYTNLHMPSRLGGGITCMLLIYVGQKLFKYREQSLHSPFLALASLIILLMYTFTIGNVNSSHLIGMIVNAYPDVATLFVGTVCGLFLVSYIGCKLSNTKLGAVLALCGRESFYIMALHMFFYRLIVRLFNPWLHVYVDSEGSFFPSFLTFWVLFIGSISLTLACVFLCRKVYRHICVKK